MLRPDQTPVYDLARQHQRDLVAEAERARLAHMVRPVRQAAADPERTPARHRLAAAWHQLCRTLGARGRVSATPRVTRLTGAIPPFTPEPSTRA
jgi:hypothetical protein